MHAFSRSALVVCFLGAAALGCARRQDGTTATQGGETMPVHTDTITVTSTAFAPGSAIPAKHTCDGADVSPDLSWSPLPASTRSIAVVCDDPDAPRGTWVHWVAYDLPPATTSLPEALPATGEIGGGGRQGKNDFRKTGYGGPCPPPGNAHRYYFKVYALDSVLGLDPGKTKADVEKAMRGHVVAQGELMGTYRRS